MYVAGHIIEAAAATIRYRKRRLLDVACRLADHIESVFWNGTGKEYKGNPGHQEIELALVKLYQATQNEKYFGSKQVLH